MNINFSFPVLDQINASLAQLVAIQKQRLELDKKNMTPQIIQALIDALNSLTALVTSEAGDHAALLTAQQSLATLQATDAALQDPALTAAANAAVAAAAAVTPPAVIPPVTPITPVPPVVDPNATNPDGSLVSGNVTNPDGSVTTTAGTVIPAPAPAAA